MASQESSEACCTLPPVQGKDYSNKGNFTEIAGLKTYKTGQSSATTAIILIYDVFGFGAQIQQGADLLANPKSDKHKYQVYIPDFLKGNLADPGWFPPDSKEKQTAMGKYFGPGGPAEAGPTLKKLGEIVEALKAEDRITKFGIVGYCWGGKMVSLASVEGTAFSAAAEVHPSAMAIDDAPKITIPICILASKDEDAKVTKGFGEALTVPKFIDTYSKAPHGWMATRADLEDPQSKSDYERGYATVAKFFHEHL